MALSPPDFGGINGNVVARLQCALPVKREGIQEAPTCPVSAGSCTGTEPAVWLPAPPAPIVCADCPTPRVPIEKGRCVSIRNLPGDLSQQDVAGIKPRGL